jgi:exonuclease III
LAKRLDHFLIVDPLLESVDRIREWLGGFGDSDHNPIVLEIAHGGDKPSSPFKFNGD